ncbi:hypothetical protein [Flavobacterium sp. WC2509]|uniref:hypothetical protein n=1 Tax=Flavobacterium sp. WC2509 TaxID=3461406 RepID=UPI004044EA49
MKIIIYASTLFLILSCNNKVENNNINSVKKKLTTISEDTLTNKVLDTVSKDNSFDTSEISLSLEKKLIGKWELSEFDLSEENDGDQEKPSGVIWIFKNNHICEERSDSSNPNDITVYEYKISQKNCETKMQSKEFFYINLKNKTLPGDDYCFSIDIGKSDDNDQDILRLYAYGAMAPDVLRRR